MIIKLSPSSPLSRAATLEVYKSGDALTINGVLFDFSQLLPGATLPESAIDCESIDAPVRRLGEQLVVQLVLPCWADSIEQARFPADIHNPEDGPVNLPGLEPGEPITPAVGSIDWTQAITAEDKAVAAATSEMAKRRASADSAIDPLQDAVDLEEDTEAEAAKLKAWKKYRIALIRVPDQPGYPDTIDWPAPPA